MATNNPAGTVQRMFAAFRVSDLDAVLDTVDSDTRWATSSKAELVPRFFESILRRLDVRALEANAWVVEGDTVVVLAVAHER